MFTLGVIFIAICVVPAPIWCWKIPTSSTITELSAWCTELNKNLALKVQYPSVPAQCCSSKYGCNKFIGAKKENYGLKNEGSWPIRLCSCEQDFYECMMNSKIGIEGLQVTVAFARSNCFRPKQCPAKGKCKTDNYEVVNSAQGVRMNYDESGPQLSDDHY